MKVLRFVTLAAGLLVASCTAHAPDYSLSDAGVVVPGSWASTNAGLAGIDRSWLGRFRDARLERLVAVAITANKDLAIAAARVDRARSAVRVADSALKPASSLSLQSSRRKQVFVGFPFGGGGVPSSISEVYNLGLNVDWEIDLWGRIRAGKSAALADLQSEGLTYSAARASLAAQVARGYFNAVEASEQVTLAEEAIEILEKASAAIRDRYESAIEDQGGTAAQLRLALSDIASAKAQLAERKGIAQQSKRRLEILLGKYPQGQLGLATKLPRLPKRPPSGLPSGLLQRRPDILSAERRYAASVVRIKEAKLARFPSFSLTGSVGTTTESLKDVLNSDFGIWSVGGQLVQPLLLNGRTQAEIAARKATQAEALAQLQKTVLGAFGEVEDALAAESDLAAREAAVAEALELAIDAADSAESDYGGGTGDVITLLQAKNQRITIASQLAALRRARLVNRVNLHLALGGDYQVRGK